MATISQTIKGLSHLQENSDSVMSLHHEAMEALDFDERAKQFLAALAELDGLYDQWRDEMMNRAGATAVTEEDVVIKQVFTVGYSVGWLATTELIKRAGKYIRQGYAVDSLGYLNEARDLCHGMLRDLQYPAMDRETVQPQPLERTAT